MPDKMPADIDEAVYVLSSRLREIVKTVPDGSAIAFSGGVDSSLLLQLTKEKVIPYTFGLKDSPDIRNAISAAKALGVTCRVMEVTPEQAINAAKSVRKIDPEIRRSDLGFESVLYLVASGIDEKILVTGQGADEIFYGYRRFLNDQESNRESLEKLFQITLKREARIAEEFGKRLVTPYLDPEILTLADLPKNWSIREGVNKYILRLAASKCGVPEAIAFRPKKAAQFGSGIQKLILKSFK